MANNKGPVAGKKAIKNVKLQQQLDELISAGIRRPDGIDILLGEKLPRHPDYAANVKRYAFLEASYKGGSAYKRANDAEGRPLLVRNEQESNNGWERRMRLASCHNFSKPLVDKMVGFVFSSPITRDTSDAFVEWSDNVGEGTDICLSEFMRRATMLAAILGRWYITLDSSKPEDAYTQAQTVAAGSRIILRDLHPKQVLDWRCEPKQLLVADDTAGEFGGARLWTDDFYQVIQLDKDGLVASIGAPEAHAWAAMPIVEVSAHAQSLSMIEDVAELQASLYNLDSILKEEISKQTFSQWWLASPNVRPEDLQSLDVGSRRVLVLPVDPATIKFERLSSDVSQAQSIRETMAADIMEIYRIVGLKDPTTESGPESGRALKIRFTESAFIATAIADAAEDAEEKITELWSEATGIEVEGPDYPDSFDDEDVQAELNAALSVATSTFPPSIKRAQLKKWADAAFSASIEADELKEIHEEIELFGEEPEQPADVEQAPEAISSKALEAGTQTERKEHPQLSEKDARNVAADHLSQDPKYYK